ncbi:Major facilitator superfamily domain, general substrate transporter [Pseudocohnilembus persalinus]|uniref:Major facilitator superfamily domain, general substrate transporter n=1 Tax=Pseudocohnilembus persalinus TaxID=266149 RepID=A0A0V0QBL2_PSEPJ|nr:Major facilitator superfamily domain, general substrate transporter [Pseudocohnilembus persalinus]|eukprot:KRW99629.1 Major facilitator superfamily domain, general substrate transporter [Pseudocohnilembus persalinus]
MYEELDTKGELSQIIAGLNLNNKHITQEINEIFNEKNDKKQNRRKSSSQDSRNKNQNINQQAKQSFKRYMGPHKKSIRNHICALFIGITAYTHGFYPLLQNSIQYFGMGNFGIIAQFAVWFAMVFGGTLSGYISQLFSIRTCMLGGTLFTLMSYCGIVICHYFTQEFYIVFQILEYLGVLFFYCGYQLTYGCQLLQGLQQITNQYWMCIVYGLGNLSCAYFSSYLNGILLKENLNLILGYLIFIFFVPYLYLIQEYSEYSKEDEQIGCCNSEDQNKNTAQYNNVSVEHDNMLELSARDYHDEEEHHEHQEFKQEEEDIEYRKQNFIETDEL